jgi:hypothetical protein
MAPVDAAMVPRAADPKISGLVMAEQVKSIDFRALEESLSWRA